MALKLPLSDVERSDVVTGPVKVHINEAGEDGLDLGYTHIYFTGMAGLDIMQRLMAGFHIDISYPQSYEKD